jgi:hypothetical protein
MFVACNHRGGLNCNGVIIAGPAPILPATLASDINKPREMFGYAITETDDPRFASWATRNAETGLVSNGTIVWANSEAELQFALFHGRRSGRWAVPSEWGAPVGHAS